MPDEDAPQPVKLSLPLEYQQSLFQELRAEDELVVLARGLGLMRLVTNLLHSYDAAGNNLVVVVGADEQENGWMGEALAEHAAVSGSPRARGLTVVNTDSQSVASRQKMYAAGGIFSVTSRILVVDLLVRLLDPESITGIVVLHAERVVATSTEAFILRLYRQRNKAGFLKALSDNPEPLASGFSPLARTMRNLFVTKASLWPRFQVAVARSLEGKNRAEVIELEVPMTDSIRDMQNAILECVEVSIQELKKSNTGLDMDDWNLDNALLGNFDVMIRKQLEPNWHRVSRKTQQIVNDLSVLRALLGNVLTYDAVSFLERLDTIHAAHSPQPGSTRQTQSPWLFLDAAQTLFDTARRRVYAAQPKAVSQGGAEADVDALRPVLEELPKWKILAEVLEEMDRDMYLEPTTRDDSNGSILIMCSSVQTCRQLRDYLQTMYLRPSGSKQHDDDDDDEPQASAAFMMRRRLRKYLLWKKKFARVSATLLAENQKALSGAADPRASGRGGHGGSGSGRAATNKRRRVRGGAGAGAGSRTSSARMENGAMAQYLEKPGEVAELMAEVRVTEAEEEEEGEKEEDEEAADSLEDVEDHFGLYEMQDLVVVHAYEGDADEHVLEEVKPRYIVMYEPDAGFIRRVEVYRSSHASRNVRVYFLYYGGSTEEQRYLTAVRREKDAFTKAIRERASMSLVMTTTSTTGPEDAQEALLRTVNTRIAGGGRLTTATATPPRVVVDMREFRSSLPCLLHGRGLDVVPCMLTVGDYILTPDMCVERKSISDLISSLRDGRLYAQAESMFQHYRHPLLLIEFDQGRAFTLEPFGDLSGGPVATAANASDVQSKLVLLTLAFPRLRILWSSSPVQTADMFSALKAHEHEPDPMAAVRAGLDDDDGGGNLDRPFFNRQPREMLAAVPGVTQVNVQGLVMGAENVREVANMEVGRLAEILGQGAARSVYGFFNRNVMEEEGEGE
ncbi:MUS38-like protein [Ophiocordyceps camponoti-floridani]|uniref:MUS38-like protein n=1 Tax=Ophiocordyceps camponoti-floridani TaxID=2030778 RepID=A0A8H4Q2R1_9HYPO|nr:MUS38-like protein [Ophiocordyceps camponoti-floridani]